MIKSLNYNYWGEKIPVYKKWSKFYDEATNECYWVIPEHCLSERDDWEPDRDLVREEMILDQ